MAIPGIFGPFLNETLNVLRQNEAYVGEIACFRGHQHALRDEERGQVGPEADIHRSTELRHLMHSPMVFWARMYINTLPWHSSRRIHPNGLNEHILYIYLRYCTYINLTINPVLLN